MPLYEYECRKCGQRTEKIENFSGPYLKKCPKCGGKIDRLIGAPTIQFKGSGWYVTDYAGKGSSGDSSKTEKAEKAEKAEKVEAGAAKDGEAKPAKESKDTASAKDTEKKSVAKKEK